LFYWCKSTKTGAMKWAGQGGWSLPQVCWRVLTCADVLWARSFGGLPRVLKVYLGMVFWAWAWSFWARSFRGSPRALEVCLGMVFWHAQGFGAGGDFWHAHISPTHQPGVSRGVQEYKYTVPWQRKHNMAHGGKEHCSITREGMTRGRVKHVGGKRSAA